LEVGSHLGKPAELFFLSSALQLALLAASVLDRPFIPFLDSGSQTTTAREMLQSEKGDGLPGYLELLTTRRTCMAATSRTRFYWCSLEDLCGPDHRGTDLDKLLHQPIHRIVPSCHAMGPLK
jgi:hypothetical protein